ncbi:MAG TPA: hypothetical protein VFP31_08435 [Gaiellaceae bacterium]|nr:hypothetical protein [Gaiellaceae bacterium]
MSVAEQYVHISKRIEPWEPVMVDGAELKWYEIAPADQPVPADIRALAGTALDTGVFDLRGELGFVLLHRCGESFYFLIVLTWNNDNEVWETVWAKNGEDDPAFAPWPVDGTHRPTFCVWELGAVWHEQQAWSRYLRSPRDHEARQAYLNDSYSGEV